MFSLIISMLVTLSSFICLGIFCVGLMTILFKLGK
jgi:hypothetical protein